MRDIEELFLRVKAVILNSDCWTKHFLCRIDVCKQNFGVWSSLCWRRESQFYNKRDEI